MKLIRYNKPSDVTPFRSLTAWRDIFDPVFADRGFDALFTHSLSPALEVVDGKENVTVKLELAGLKKEDFDISFENDVLTVSGERKSETEAKEGETVRSERVYGSFSRSVTVHAPIKADEISANYADGILTVVLPKAEEAKPKKIAVS